MKILLRQDRRIDQGKRLGRPIGSIGGASVISFREHHGFDRVIEGVSAATRFLGLVPGDVIMDNLASDTGLASLVYWDVAHSLPIGSMMTCFEAPEVQTPISKGYYSQSFQQIAAHTWRKVANLPAERDAGLSKWTFGIPVGPEDAVFLNAAVRRILSLGIPEFEILLCGRPGANFAYNDRVRIVGQELVGSPPPISAKKNRLVEEAAYGNVCILHDRVFLPSDFLEGVERYGDTFPLVGLQSLYFDDRYNFVARRYSDCHWMGRALSTVPMSPLKRGDSEEMSTHGRAALSMSEHYDYASRNPLYHDNQCYPTGSLYIAKKSVWQLNPLNDQLRWGEMEDAEHGLRNASFGVPSSVNPFIFTQSLNSRPLLTWMGRIAAQDPKGRVRLAGLTAQWFPSPRKPAIKVRVEDAEASARRFAEKYQVELGPEINFKSSQSYFETVAMCVANGRFLPNRNGMEQFYSDVGKMLTFEQISTTAKADYLRHVRVSGYRDLIAIFLHGTALTNLAGQRPSRNIFCEAWSEYFPKRGLLTSIGTALTALVLGFRNGAVVYHPDGLNGFLRAIKNSTPYEDAV